MIGTILFYVLLFAFVWYLRNRKSSSSSGGGSGGNANFHSKALYTRAYTTQDAAAANESLPKPSQATGAAQGMPQCKFMLTAKKQLARDYILVVDRSGSMSGERWKEAEKAVASLAPYVCKFDPDGISLIFFSSDVVQFDEIKSASDVTQLFAKYRPSGSTNLALALHKAFELHFGGQRGASTILVITDGAPDSQGEVERIIRRAANSIERDEELSISFVQIGSDHGATKFLKHLDDTLQGVKYDIVDTISAAEARGISFPELIARSIYD